MSPRAARSRSLSLPRAGGALSLLLALAVALVARADGGRTLHEHVPDLETDEGTLLVSSGGEQPGAIVYQGEVLPAPEADELGPRPGADERAMRAGPGDSRQTEEPGRRSPSFRPDRVTELNGTVGYYTVFTPTIAPFKRVTALDAVTTEAGTPILQIGDRSRRRVEVVGAHAPAPDARPRDRFWGSVVLDFSEGSSVPFPAVSPESRILTLETTPSTELRFERDGADNLYASAVGSSAREVRVVFLMDAPRSYFGQPIPDGPVDVHADRVRPLPAWVQRDAETFLSELGLSRDSTFSAALSALVAHFRAFEESAEPPRDTGNIYLDLSRGMRGICRHRAYGFVISAQALGMYARFVQNEAHAWVEVELPADAGWLRVDLGGAATGLETHGAEQRPPYQPNVVDPLPRPEAYERAYEEARRMSGGGRSPGDAPGASFDPDAPAQPGADATGQGGAQGGQGPGGPPSRRVEPGSVRAADEANQPPRGLLALSVDRQRFEVLRGQELVVTGTARGAGGGVAGLRVEALLRAPRGEAEWLLGVTVSDAEGRYRGAFGVPPDLPVGDYELVVRTPGNRDWTSAVAP